MPIVMAIVIAMAAAVLFILTAEKIHKLSLKQKPLDDTKPKASDTENLDSQENFTPTDQPQPSDRLPLKGKLNTPLAQIIFKKALASGLMTMQSHNSIRHYYEWSGSKVLLAYLCGRIYCGDYSEALPNNDVIWRQGKSRFPSTDLDRLFNQRELGQQRNNRNDATPPDGFEKIDQLFS